MAAVVEDNAKFVGRVFVDVDEAEIARAQRLGEQCRIFMNTSALFGRKARQQNEEVAERLAQAEREIALYRHALTELQKADKTPFYKTGEPRADGRTIPTQAKWKTPYEIAEAVLANGSQIASELQKGLAESVDHVIELRGLLERDKRRADGAEKHLEAIGQVLDGADVPRKTAPPLVLNPGTPLSPPERVKLLAERKPVKSPDTQRANELPQEIRAALDLVDGQVDVSTVAEAVDRIRVIRNACSNHFQEKQDALRKIDSLKRDVEQGQQKQTIIRGLRKKLRETWIALGLLAEVGDLDEGGPCKHHEALQTIGRLKGGRRSARHVAFSTKAPTSPGYYYAIPENGGKPELVQVIQVGFLFGNILITRRGASLLPIDGHCFVLWSERLDESQLDPREKETVHFRR